MKKRFVLFFALCYLVLSSGYIQYAHACKAMAVKLYSLTNTEHQNSDKPCPICSNQEKGLAEQKKDCCQYEAQLVKVDDSVKSQPQLDYSVKFWGDAIPNKMLGSVFDLPLITDDTKQSFLYFSSKVPVRGNPLYILNCVYRI